MDDSVGDDPENKTAQTEEEVQNTEVDSDTDSGESDPESEGALDGEVLTRLSKIQIEDQKEPSKLEHTEENKPKSQQGLSESSLVHDSQPKQEDKGKGTSGKAQTTKQPRKDDKGKNRSVEPAESYARSSTNTAQKNNTGLGRRIGGSSSRKPRYVQEKKWTCAWCSFGPLDWTYDTHCVECGRERDMYCGVDYQTRMVRGD